MSKIMRVYYDNAGHPYKDYSLSTLYPIVGNEFTGANNTTEIHFYTDNLGIATWVANCKLPNGSLLNRLLVPDVDSDGHTYFNLPLDSELTSVVGHLKIGLNGYAGNISIDEEELENNDLVVISGTPTIIATGIIDIAMNYSPIVIPVSQLTPSEYQELLALIGTKADVINTIYCTNDITLLDPSAYNEGQIFFSKSNSLFYKVENAQFVLLDTAPNKVDKSNDPSILYGTDNLGQQTTYTMRDVADQIEGIILNNYYTKTEIDDFLTTKQNTLFSGINIKTINGQSILGSGNYIFDYSFNENSTNAVQNSAVAKAINDIVHSFNGYCLSLFLYKKNTYLDDNNVETTLDGYNLYKIPVKDNYGFINIFWDKDIDVLQGLAQRFACKVKHSNNNIESVSDISSSFRFANYVSSGYRGVGIFFNDTNTVKEIIFCINADYESVISVEINRTNSKLNESEETNFYKELELTYDNPKHFISNSLYWMASDGSIQRLADGYKAIKIPMKQGDKVKFNGNISLPYYGQYKTKAGDGSYNQINAVSEFTATEDCLAALFVASGQTRTITYYPVNATKIDADKVDGLEEKIEEVIESSDTSHFSGLNGVAFGTSLTYRSQTTGGFLTKLTELSGITFDNQGIGSSTILGNMLTAIKNYTGYSGKRVALLEGFVNDWYQEKTLGTYTDTEETTVCGCVRSAINYMYSQNANLTIFLILDHYGRNYGGANCSSQAIINGKTQYEYYEEIAKVAESLGVIVVKQYKISEISENTPQYLLDNIHMNSLGAIRSAYSIWSIIKQYYPNNI